MKNIKYFLVLVVGMLALASCDQNDTEGNIYPAKNNEAFFEAKNSSYTFGELDPDKCEVILTRGNANGAASVPVTVESESSIFTVSSAEFADGEYQGTISVTFDRESLTPGENYVLVLDIPENPIKERTISHSLTIRRDYVWKKHLTGTFTSQFFNGSSWEVEMEKAEGAEAYRLVDVYEDGYHIAFTVDGDVITPLASLNSSKLYPFATGYEHSTYGPVTFQIDADPSYTYFDAAGKKLNLNGRFVVSEGTFGWYDESFAW